MNAHCIEEVSSADEHSAHVSGLFCSTRNVPPPSSQLPPCVSPGSRHTHHEEERQEVLQAHTHRRPAVWCQLLWGSLYLGEIPASLFCSSLGTPPVELLASLPSTATSTALTQPHCPASSSWNCCLQPPLPSTYDHSQSHLPNSEI